MNRKTYNSIQLSHDVSIFLHFDQKTFKPQFSLLFELSMAKMLSIGSKWQNEDKTKLKCGDGSFQIKRHSIIFLILIFGFKFPLYLFAKHGNWRP